MNSVAVIGSTYDVMKNFSRTAKITLCTLYLVVITLLIWEYQRYLRDRMQKVIYSSKIFVVYHSYCVHYDVIAPPISDFERIGQILHVSADILDERIVEQVTNWNAPMSLSIVLPSQDNYDCTVDFLNRISMKYSSVAKYLRAHVVFPEEWSSNCSLPTDPRRLPLTNCKRRQRSPEEIATYPANLARNVARMFSSSRYIVITDYEHMFSAGFEEKMRRIADTRLIDNPDTLLIYRIFEVDENVRQLPRNKAELRQQFSRGEAVIFHARYYKGAHNIPGLMQWFAKNKSEDGIFLQGIKYTRPSWEPQFVSLKDIPLHDEAFPFQIRDNTVLRWELCRANYSFDVVDDLFMVHRGIKEAKMRGITTKIQLINNQKFNNALAEFNFRMDKMYPETKEICPNFSA